MTAKYVPAIDGLRAVAIGVVFLSHLFMQSVIPGGLGVTLFFFISGYLITGILIDEKRNTGRVAIGTFYLRRFMRLAPALLVMVATVSFTYWIVFGETSASEITAAIFYFMNFHELADGAMPLPLGPLWSLAIEEHFYLVFPIVVAAFWQFRERLFIAMIAMCLLVLLWRCALVANGAVPDRTYIGTDTRIDSIMFGALLAIAIRLDLNVAWLASKSAISAGVGLILISLIVRNPTFRETLRYSIQGVAFLPLFYVIVCNRSRVTSIFELPLITWIGKISYSLYLWHFPIMMLVGSVAPDHLPPPLAGVIIVVSSVAISAASYYWIETPMRAMARRPSQRLNVKC